MSGSLELPLVPIPPNREIEPLPGPIVRPTPPEPVERDRAIDVRDRVNLSRAARDYATAQGLLHELLSDPDADAERARAGARALAEEVATHGRSPAGLAEALRGAETQAPDARTRALSRAFAEEFGRNLPSDETEPPTSS